MSALCKCFRYKLLLCLHLGGDFNPQSAGSARSISGFTTPLWLRFGSNDVADGPGIPDDCQTLDGVASRFVCLRYLAVLAVTQLAVIVERALFY